MNETDYLRDLYIFLKEYENIEAQVKTQENSHDEHGNPMTNQSHRFFSYIIEFYFRNKFPVVVSDDDYIRLDAKPYYHGFRDYDFGASFLTDWSRHYGVGHNLHGFYMSEKIETAMVYTTGNSGRNAHGRILELKHICKNIINKSILNKIQDNLTYIAISEGYKNCFHPSCIPRALKEVNDIEKSFWEMPQTKAIIQFIRQNQGDSVAEEFITDFIYNDSVISIFYGYDGSKFRWSGVDEDILVLFDISKIVVPESEAKRFLKRSGKHKDAVVNFLPLSEINIEKK